MTVKKAILTLYIITSLLLSAKDATGETFEDRRTWLLDEVRGVDVFGGEGKIALPVVCARLYETGGTDTDAIQRAATSSDVGDRFFRMLGQVRAYYLAGENYTPAQLNAFKDILAEEQNWNNTGTENHRLMTWTSGYLMAQAFPGELWNWKENDVTTKITSPELMERLLNLIITRGQWRFSGGNSEFLSPNYDTFSVAALANLYDFAQDPDVRDVADAMLHYHVGQMALGNHEGYILAPFSRNARQGQRSELSISQWIPWLYWGHNNPLQLETSDRYVIYLAISSWRPSSILDAIGKNDVPMPYTVRTQQPQFQRSPLRYIVRTTYRHDNYSISSGVVRHVPSAFQLDDSQFSIAWSTADENRFLEVFHPYWRTKSRGNDSWSGPTSPFMQSVQMENSAILLYEIPEQDPWAGIGQWASERNETLSQLAQVRVPMSMIEKIPSEDDWFFFREGTTYIGIKALGSESTYEPFFFPPGENLSYAIIRSFGAKTGFIFEVGDESEFGSFQNFQSQLKNNSLTINRENFEVTYTNSRGDELKIRYNTDLETPDGSIPSSWINGRPLDHENWPFIESPNLNLRDRIMTLTDGTTWMRIDWSGSVPLFTEGTGNPEPVVMIRYRAEGELEEPFSYAFDSIYEPDLFEASGLPQGLEIDAATGLIEGTPVESGTFEATITATNSAGSSETPLTLVINEVDPFLKIFPEAILQSDGQYLVEPIGLFDTRFFPVVSTVQHGYWWITSDGEDGFFAYDYQLGNWLWSTTAFFPGLFWLSIQSSGFVWYIEEAWGPDSTERWFYAFGPDSSGFFY